MAFLDQVSEHFLGAGGMAGAFAVYTVQNVGHGEEGVYRVGVSGWSGSALFLWEGASARRARDSRRDAGATLQWGVVDIGGRCGSKCPRQGGGEGRCHWGVRRG